MHRLLQYAFLLALSSGAFCATRGNIVPSPGHDMWDAAAGFPGGYVSSLTQTTDGYIWIGTSKGLVRYDGVTFVLIRQSDPGRERKFPVFRVLADSKDQLWATDDHTHLFRYADGRLTGPLPDNGKHQFLPSLLGKTRDGHVLFASEVQGVVEYENGSAQVLLDASLVPRSPTAMAQTADGALWIGTRGAGLFRLNGTQGHPELQHFGALTNLKVNCLLPIGGSALLIGTDKGLLRLQNGNLSETHRELAGLEILSLASGHDGDVWIGSNGRVFKVHGRDIDQEGRIRTLADFKVRGPVSALFQDRDGDLWIGGPEVIERYRASGFTTYLGSAGLPCSNCGAIYIDRHDRAWFAPWDGGLFQLAQDSIHPIEAAGLKDDTVYSIAGGANDEVWVARKYGGVTRFRLRNYMLAATTYTRLNGQVSDSVYSIYRAPDGAVWAGTLHSGLSRFHNEIWHTFTTQEGLPSNTISAITGNGAGEIFVGTPSGLAVLKHDRWIAYTEQEGLPPGAITSLQLDDADTLWIGTTKGISFLHSGTVHVPLGMPDALYGEILGIAESNGWLWITTRDHVLRARCNALLRQSFEPGDYREFGLTEGLPSTEGVKRDRSVVKDDRGRIWLSLNKGISILQPSSLSRPAFPVTIRLDGILIDGRLVSSDLGVHIPAGRHRLTFRYAGINVSNPDAVRYRYRLDNVDLAWSEPTALREIDYTNVPPGQFRFQVIAQNPDGVWNEAGASLDFTILPAYYQTNLFRALCLGIFVALLWAAYQVRVRQLQQQEKKLRNVIETMPIFAWTALPDGSRDFANQQVQEYSGLSVEETNGSSWQGVVHPADLKQHLEKWHASLATGEPFQSEARYRRADGEYRWFLARGVPMRDEHGKIVKWYGVSTDIEDRKRAEQLQADLAHVNRVSTMGELTASLAHEIKQPIGAAVTNAEACARLLDHDQPDVLEAREAALEMVKDAARAAHIIDRVRSLYRKNSSNKEAVDVNEVIGEMLIILHRDAIRHSVTIRTDLTDALPKVTADRVQLQQVLMNLMLNGIQAMEKTGGSLTLKSRLDPEGKVLISVSDTGSGLPIDKIEQIFDAFFTTKPDGSGMGLAISRSIIESHGGRVWATANADRGATLHFTLPTLT